MGVHRPIRCLTALALCAALLCPLTVPAAAAPLTERTFQVSQAQRMALSGNSDLSQQYNKILLKKMKYVEAVKGIQAKIKNLRSFRWTPLLSFKFPQKLDLTAEYDLNIKPLTLQTEIDTMQHRLADLEYEIVNKVNKQFYEAYTLQEKSAFTQQRLDDAKDQLARNQAGLAAGRAAQNDVDTAQKRVDSLTTDLSNQLRELEQAKAALKDMVKLDVSTGYRFVNPFKTAAIPREALDSLTQYTLDHDQAFYECKAATATALLNINSYESLMRNQYGSKMAPIQGYINMARQGMDIDYAAFQLQYDQMLKNLDKPWAGSIRILFFRFTKEWFKGEISGTRYIEDEIYAVYTACMDYSNALKEQKSTKKGLRGQVRDSYESLVTAWNTYLTLDKLATASKDTLDRLVSLNRLGKADYTEVADQQEAYQVAQLDRLDALADYNLQLSAFDRLTCGGVTKYLQDTATGLEVGDGGDAYAILDPIEEPYYYIYSSVADLTFYIGVSIPDGFEPAVDAFEVWYGGTQIGERTQVGTELRHLSIDYGGTNTLLLRLYKGSSFVAEREIDASVPRGPLDLQSTAPPPPTEKVIGSYTVETTAQNNVTLSTLKLTVDASVGAMRYSLTYGEKGIYTTELRPLREDFTYLSLLISSLADVTLHLYDGNSVPLTTARFDAVAQQIIELPPQA